MQCESCNAKFQNQAALTKHQYSSTYCQKYFLVQYLASLLKNEEKYKSGISSKDIHNLCQQKFAWFATKSYSLSSIFKTTKALEVEYNGNSFNVTLSNKTSPVKASTVDKNQYKPSTSQNVAASGKDKLIQELLDSVVFDFQSSGKDCLTLSQLDSLCSDKFIWYKTAKKSISLFDILKSSSLFEVDDLNKDNIKFYWRRSSSSTSSNKNNNERSGKNISRPSSAQSTSSRTSGHTRSNNFERKKRLYPSKWEKGSKKLLGERPPSGSTVDFERKLDQYPLPSEAKQLLKADLLDPYHINTQLEEMFYTNIASYVTKENYVDGFRSLLYAEEVQLRIDIRHYDQRETFVQHDKHNRHLYQIDVPGLAEKRPSVLRGDSIVCRFEDNPSILYKGFVHFVNLSDIRVSFHRSMPLDVPYTVKFSFNRTPWKLMHRALENQDLIERLFTETPKTGLLVSETYDLKKLNDEQKKCINYALYKPSVPILVYGPPGTGKTYTLIECARIILDQSPNHRILFCAPSNAASDLIAERLISLGIRNIFRMNSVMRDPKTLSPEWLMDYSDYQNQIFKIPDKNQINDYGVLVCTCTTSGYLYSVGVSPGSFSHIIIDEAGEALEPEVLIPLSLATTSTTIILAGDPKQLGPIVHSPLGLKYRLDISLLERLSHAETCLKVHLLESYRSHPDILLPYSKLFYNNELISRATEESFLYDDTAIRFYHVKGREKRDSDSPSWYNLDEITQVVQQIQLIHLTPPFKNKHITNKDIGVITPYRKQVLKIRQRLYGMGSRYDGITVGTTENFQGQERTIIILSTVRSRRESLVHDTRFRLGFLNNPKRMNVAISRAIARMIIIGNAEVLLLDPYWKEMIKYYISKKSFIAVDRFDTRSLENSEDIPASILNSLNDHLDKETEEEYSFEAEWRDYQ
jgi:hypothetical protein